jgi:hypothetical protein
MSVGWPPEVARWLNGQDEISETVLIQLGKMRRDLPNAEQDLELTQMTRSAARKYVGDTAGDDRGARMEIVARALQLPIPPGSTVQQVASTFLA